MARRKGATVVEPKDDTEQQIVEEQQLPSYELEPVTDDIRSRLAVWGNSTRLTISQLEQTAPGWAAFLLDIFSTVGYHMEKSE